MLQPTATPRVQTHTRRGQLAELGGCTRQIQPPPDDLGTSYLHVGNTTTAAGSVTRSSSETALHILGMPDIGTSAFSGVLSLVGFDIPGLLKTACPRYDRGGSKPISFRELNGRLLISAGTTRDSLTELPVTRWASTAEGFVNEAVDLLTEEIGTS